jgi:SAM-dependent methyltransferase
MHTASARWGEQLAAWALPDHITAAVADSPWALPTQVFARRADHHVAAPTGVSFERAAEALRPHGDVLDVGAGAGAAALPLAPWTDHLTAVDPIPSMVEALRERADRLGVDLTAVTGTWPDVAASVAPADVVVCHHVAYNVPDLDAFALALHEHARRRVVIELSAAHPMRVLNPLWKAMHGLDRPDGPTAQDAVAVLREAGLDPRTEAWQRPPRPEYPSFAEFVRVTRQRLCLPPERTDELAGVLVELGVDPDHPRDLSVAGPDVVTLWWDTHGNRI